MLTRNMTSKENEFLLATLPCYKLVTCFSRTQKSASGTSVLVRSHVEAKPLNILNHIPCVEGNFKYSACHINYNEKTFTVVSSPEIRDSPIGDFLNKLLKLLLCTCLKNKTFF